MTDTPARPIREAWAAGRPARNAWLTIPDTHLAEMVAARGISEAVTVDLQHGLFDHRMAVHAIRVHRIRRRPIAPLSTPDIPRRSRVAPVPPVLLTARHSGAEGCRDRTFCRGWFGESLIPDYGSFSLTSVSGTFSTGLYSFTASVASGRRCPMAHSAPA